MSIYRIEELDARVSMNRFLQIRRYGVIRVNRMILFGLEPQIQLENIQHVN